MAPINVDSPLAPKGGEEAIGHFEHVYAANSGGVDVAYCFTDSQAQIAAHRIGEWGSDGIVLPRCVLALDDGRRFLVGAAITMTDTSESERLLVESGLKKLDPAERLALGFPAK